MILWEKIPLIFPIYFSPFDQWDFFCNGRISHHRWTGPIIFWATVFFHWRISKNQVQFYFSIYFLNLVNGHLTISPYINILFLARVQEFIECFVYIFLKILIKLIFLIIGVLVIIMQFEYYTWVPKFWVPNPHGYPRVIPKKTQKGLLHKMTQGKVRDVLINSWILSPENGPQ